MGLKKKITSYPSVKKDLTSDFVYNEDDATVVIDGWFELTACYYEIFLHQNNNYLIVLRSLSQGELITSRGPGTAMDFALSITEYLVGKQTRDEVTEGLIYTK